jgi:adenylate kinase family enzyme
VPILENFPYTVRQAEALHKLLASLNKPVTAVFEFRIGLCAVVESCKLKKSKLVLA